MLVFLAVVPPIAHVQYTRCARAQEREEKVTCVPQASIVPLPPKPPPRRTDQLSSPQTTAAKHLALKKTHITSIMDVADQWMLEYLPGFLPDPLPQLLHEHVLHPHAYVQVLKRKAMHLLARLFNAAYPFLSPVADRLARALHDSPDLVVLAALLVALAAALQVLLYVRRVVAWGVRLALRMAFWAGVVALGAVVWRRGLEESVRDVVVAGGKVAGYAAAIGEVWMAEYRRYEAQTQRVAQAGAGAGARRQR
ncbi:uncharacterized protein E0L32_009735 [Thyridium curvatum]|uniref:Uncharacterized protein n=1 Tax=Thyridium curvatum TaxID=1093900 RepID=A0A507AGE4_9PEZI|nr:uncharacterized protein E0L32_009735 [Thyridium curvatum]TPX08795.1 hypothetical protein E0L32_009735 [Thyridium curvatum]